MKAPQFKKEIISHFESGTSVSLSKSKKEIKANMIFDEYDNSIKAGNVRLFFTDNENYAGGGKGFYISNCGLTGGSEIKL